MSGCNKTVEVTCPECGRKAMLRGVVPFVSDTLTNCNREFRGRDVPSCPALRGAVADGLRLHSPRVHWRTAA
jgi:hypothetical protein